MDNKNTINYLNSRWWYRLIKTAYLFFFLLGLLGYPIAIFNFYGPEYDNDASYIKCANGKKFILSQNGITLYGEFMGSTDQEKAKNLCFGGVINYMEPIRMTKAEYEAKYGQAPTVENVTESGAAGKYELISKYITRNWLVIIGFSLLSILATLFIFELLRRIFYYIVLGNLRPKKQ